jgi:DNA gyrase inhibitor GyrI
MTEMNVRVVKLEPMRVASVRVVSSSAERDAWQKLRAWAEPAGLLDDLNQHPVFGFRSSAPGVRRKQYGYEFWIRIDPDVESEDGIEIKRVEGGLYAVATCEGLAFVSETWKKLCDHVQSSRSSYQRRESQELEKPYNPLAPEGEIEFDLYLPVVQRRRGH